MENWILILILGSIIGVNCHTIVYPGKSALLSYSPARGEFPVESLFGRGYFSYIDNHGISRTVNLEPNPLLGIRVDNNGELSSDLGNTVEQIDGGSLINRIENRLKPIKEFDERPMRDSLNLEKDVSLIRPSIVDSSSKVIEVSEEVKGDQILSVTIPKQQDQILLYPKTGTVIAQGSINQPGNTYWTSQNIPSTFSNQQIAAKPSVQAAFSSENPFLNQHLGIPVQNPSTNSNLGAVQQNIPSSLPGQIFFYAPTGSINSEAIRTSSGPASQAATGQFLLFPPIPINSGGTVPSSSELADNNSGTNQMQAISSQNILPASSELPSISSGAIISQGGQGQVFVSPLMAGLSPSNQSAPISSDGIPASQQAPNQALGQVVSFPTIPTGSVASSTSSNQPGFDSTLSLRPLPTASNPVLSTSVIPISGSFPGNPFFPASRFTSVAPLQEVFMIQPTNPFLSLNSKDKPISWPKPITSTTTTTSAPLFNADQKNPFLPNSLNNVVKLEDSKIQVQPIAVKPNPQLQAVLPSSIACDYHSVGSLPEQIKDTPEVEKAKREHFLAHELALAQLVKARQNNDNTDQTNESSLTLAASASDSSSTLHLTANTQLDQPVTSGPTTTLEQQTTVNAVESEIATLQSLPL